MRNADSMNSFLGPPGGAPAALLVPTREHSSFCANRSRNALVMDGLVQSLVCEWCGEPKPVGLRRHARFCSVRCRVGAHRSRARRHREHRDALKMQLGFDDLTFAYFEERAAIIEFDAGLPRKEAEILALDATRDLGATASEAWA